MDRLDVFRIMRSPDGSCYLLSIDQEHSAGSTNTGFVGTELECANHMKQSLVRIWSKTLGIRDIGTDEDFYELGGDSLLALKIAFAAKQEGIEFVPADLRSHSTISDLVTNVIWPRAMSVSIQ